MPSYYRVPAPLPHDRIVWPDDFGTRFTVFVDVEEEFDWSAPLDRAHRATTAMRAFPEAHRRFADRGVALNCMVDYPIATDGAAVDILRRVIEDGRSDIGTQLHAWVNPPFADGGLPESSYAGNLPLTLEAAKLDTLTAEITRAFGRAPRAYRAGRYGIGPHTVQLLAERGYRIDSSVRAHYSYRHDNGPDFSEVGVHAYRTGDIVELPLTTIFIGHLRRHGPAMYDLLARVPKGRAIASRLGLLSRIALTPEDIPLAAALEAVTIAAGERISLLNFSFHSPSLAPGHTPYVRDACDLRAFHGWWDAILGRLDRLGIVNATINDILKSTTF